MQFALFFKFILQSINLTLLFSIIWAVATISIFIFRWFNSIFIPKHNEPIFLDLRQNKLIHGKKIMLCAIKANPAKSIYFGHIWVVWPDYEGIKEAGFYAKNRFIAFIEILFAIISPFAIFFKQHPIKGIMRDDSGLHRDWQIEIEVDLETYIKAKKIDNSWRNEEKYSIRPSKDGKTYNCRDYALEISRAIGLKTIEINWWDFPSELFLKLLLANDISIKSNKFIANPKKEFATQS